MSLGGNYDSNQSRIDRLLVEADASRAARVAKAAIGHKSLFQRLRERVRPRRQEPDYSQATDYDSGR
jgi:hypothetical protein